MTPNKGRFDTERAYYLYQLIRRTEEEIIRLYPTDKIKSPVHLSIGQEAVAVGAMLPLAAEDVIFSNYRGHAHYIARGGNLDEMWAELYGKANGHARGKAGSMHLVDTNVNFMSASAIVSSALSNAVGYALAKKIRGEAGIVLCFHGEGATDQGVFWESLNFAALKDVPVLFICENNGYAIYSKQENRMAGANVTARSKEFGITAERFDGRSTETVFDRVKAASEWVRKHSKPYLLEIDTYRWRDHVGPGDDHQDGVRPTHWLTEEQARDDGPILAKEIGLERAAEIDAMVERDLAKAIEFAENGDFPEKEELDWHVYAS